MPSNTRPTRMQNPYLKPPTNCFVNLSTGTPVRSAEAKARLRRLIRCQVMPGSTLALSRSARPRTAVDVGLAEADPVGQSAVLTASAVIDRFAQLSE